VNATTLHVLCSIALFFIGLFCFKRVGIAILFALTFGVIKEVRDIIVNPWNMSPHALMSDCMSDMWHDVIGVVLGFLVFDIYDKTRRRNERSSKRAKKRSRS